MAQVLLSPPSAIKRQRPEDDMLLDGADNASMGFAMVDGGRSGQYGIGGECGGAQPTQPTKKRFALEGAARRHVPDYNAENLSKLRSTLSFLASAPSSSSSSSSSSIAPFPSREVQGQEKRPRFAATSSGIDEDNDSLNQHHQIQQQQHQRYSEERLKYLENNISHQREELARALHNKDSEILGLKKEAVVLKRGVAIGNSRLAQAQQQNAELQGVLAKAAEHISGLERAVQLLQSRLAYFEGSGGGGGGGGGLFSPPPPPDCF